MSTREEIKGRESKEKTEMMNTMVCKKNEIETKRFRGVRERLITIPVSEVQILRTIGEIHVDV